MILRIIVKAIYVLELAGAGAVPPTYALDAHDAATRHGVDPYDLGAYLISEHRGAYPTDKCSDSGACGLYQLTAGWVDYCGAEKGDRFIPAAAADIAACVIAYSQERHERCDGHHWMAHLKCSDRDNCYKPVRRWRKIRALLGQDQGDRG